MFKFTVIVILMAVVMIMLRPGWAAAEKTYAERLGWPVGSKVVIFHVDDTGMSHSSNVGTIKSMTQGVATSCAIMMPCAWVSEYAAWYKENPETCAGLHLTHTSEWKKYRWGPVAGKAEAPSLVDEEGCLWAEVDDVLAHATADDIETEIRAQVDRALKMGFKPSHLDSHMGTLFADEEFTLRYVKVGIEMQIPILFPGGHLQYISKREGFDGDPIKVLAAMIWAGGLPVIDDIKTDTNDWDNAHRTEGIIDVLKNMKPGILEIIVHCTDPTDEFSEITGSGPKRKSEMLAMMDPKLKQALKEEGIILTDWRELKKRRDALK